MFELSSLQDIELLSESAQIECKLAKGRDGKGEVPKDMWESYSAFANSDGGYIILGLREKKSRFTIEGCVAVSLIVEIEYSIRCFVMSILASKQVRVSPKS